MKDILDKFGLPTSPQSPDIGQKSDGRISDFQISGQPFIEENCHSRTSNDIDVKLGPVTKLDKKARQYQKVWRWCYIGICEAIVIFWIYDQFEVIRKSESGRIVCETYIFINSNFLSYKNWKQD